MSILDDIKKRPPNINSKGSGKIWLTMLIEFDVNGNAHILRTFSKPAKDSNLKFLQKERRKDDYKQKQDNIIKNIEDDTSENVSESLF